LLKREDVPDALKAQGGALEVSFTLVGAPEAEGSTTEGQTKAAPSRHLHHPRLARKEKAHYRSLGR
jgi:hypothetical protein